MSDSFQEKTEAPTPRRKEDALKKGQVPKSAELVTAMVLLGAGGLLAIAGPFTARGLAEVLAMNLQSGGSLNGVEGAVTWVRTTIFHAAVAAAPLLLGLAAVSGATAAVQARGVLSAEPLKPQWSRIAPHKNASRIWGTRAIAELVKSILKLLVIGVAMWVSLRTAWPTVMSLGQRGPAALGHALASFAVRLLLVAGSTYVVIAAIDYAYQFWTHKKQLRMTKEEVKREHKEMDGDPLVKSRLRTLGRALIRRQMFKDVPKADVVVTNPTHIAVALRYDPGVSPAPIVVAMGQRKIAERIKRLALQHGVPVIENKPLARALLAGGKIGLPIPVELYVAVAEVLAFVFRRRRTAGAWKGSAAV